MSHKHEKESTPYELVRKSELSDKEIDSNFNYLQQEMGLSAEQLNAAAMMYAVYESEYIHSLGIVLAAISMNDQKLAARNFLKTDDSILIEVLHQAKDLSEDTLKTIYSHVDKIKELSENSAKILSADILLKNLPSLVNHYFDLVEAFGEFPCEPNEKRKH